MEMERLTIEEKAELAEVYEKAAKLIETNGWWNGRLNNWNGEMCFGIAIQRADGRMLHQALMLAAEALELPEHKGGVSMAIFEWNDTNTEDGVINTLHALVNKLR